jgi:hypothetical protein
MPPDWINFGGILSVPCNLYFTEKLAKFKEKEKTINIGSRQR